MIEFEAAPLAAELLGEPVPSQESLPPVDLLPLLVPAPAEVGPPEETAPPLDPDLADLVSPVEMMPPGVEMAPFEPVDCSAAEWSAWVEATDWEMADACGQVDPMVAEVDLLLPADPVAEEVAVLVLAGMDAAEDAVDVLDAAATLRRVAGRQRLTRRLQGEELALAAHWADLHAVLDTPSVLTSRGLAGGERLIQPGGDGTPAVAEFAVTELGAVLGLSDHLADRLIADALDLRHRLPQLWLRVQAGDVDVWTARRTAEHTRALTLAAAVRVDTRVATLVGQLTWRRMKPVLDAAIIAADPPRALTDADQAAADVGVWVNDDTRHGYGSMIIRAARGDLDALDQALDLLARALLTLADPRPVQQRRAAAVAILAHPATAHHLVDLAEQVRRLRNDATHAHRTGRPELADRLDAEADTLTATWTGTPTTAPTSAPGAATDGQAAVGGDPTHGGGRADAKESQVAGRCRVDRRPFAFTDAVVYYHLTADSLTQHLTRQPGAGAGLVRIEGVGPVILDQVEHWLQHANVTVKPVIDLDTVAPADRYEVTPPIAEAIGLRFPADYSPYSTSLSRHQDHDHTTPYQPMASGGPPGQTDPALMARLSRRRHRLKTHGRWTVHQIGPLAWLWRTHHGDHYLVDAHGTTALGRL